MDKQLGRLVVIKRFVTSQAERWKQVELAEREARLLRRIEHPLLPRYLDHFEERGALYTVMAHIDGEDLATLRRRGQSFGERRALGLLHDAADVFAYLHEQAPPIIHRDIKPVNIIENAAGRFCLVDLGAATERLAGDAGSTVVGTFGYMAPEQFQGRASPASDVYALGATLLTLLTGLEPERLPHAGLGIDVRRALGDRVDVRLRTLLERMLEPDPERRPSELRPLLRALPRPGASPPSGERREVPAPSEPSSARGSRPSRAPGLPRRHGPPSLPEPLLLLVREIALPVLLGLIALVTLMLFALLNVLGKRQGAADVRTLGLDLGQGIQRLRHDMGTSGGQNAAPAEKREPEAPVDPASERRWRRRATRSRERHWG